MASLYKNYCNFFLLLDKSTEVSSEKILKVKRTGQFVNQTFNDLEDNYSVVSEGKKVTFIKHCSQYLKSSVN